MRRDIGNEILVALVAAGVLAFGVAAAIILSMAGGGSDVTLTGTASEDIAFTSTADNMLEPTETVPTSAPTQPDAAHTNTNAPAMVTKPIETTVASSATGPIISVSEPSATQTRIQASATLSPTSVPPTRTPTPISPTATQTALPMAIAIPTASATATSSLTPTTIATQTPQPSVTLPRTPTATNTLTATATRTPVPTVTATQKPPTRTPAPSASDSPTLRPATRFTPTATHTRTPASTPVRATHTPTPAITPEPAHTALPILSPSPLVTLASSGDAAQDTACPPPKEWVPYTLRRGDTLSALSQLTGASIGEIQVGNCLDDPNAIRANTTIFLPIIATPGASVSPTVIVIAKEGCTYPGAVISQPETGEKVSGSFDLVGSAYVPDFWYYQLEIRPNNADDYDLLLRSNSIVIEAELDEVNTHDYGIGLFWIQLQVVDTKGSIAPTCVIPLIFQ